MTPSVRGMPLPKQWLLQLSDFAALASFLLGPVQRIIRRFEPLLDTVIDVFKMVNIPHRQYQRYGKTFVTSDFLFQLLLISKAVSAGR